MGHIFMGLSAWLVVSFPVGLLVGRMIAFQSKRPLPQMALSSGGVAQDETIYDPLALCVLD